MNSIVSFRLCTLSDEELLQKVDTACDNMYRTGNIPPRHLPAIPDSDFDLLIGELLLRFKKLTEEREQKEEPEVHECKVCGKPFGDNLSLYGHYDEEHNKNV